MGDFLQEIRTEEIDLLAWLILAHAHLCHVDRSKFQRDKQAMAPVVVAGAANG